MIFSTKALHKRLAEILEEVPSEQRKLRSFVEAPFRGKISMSGSEVSPVVVRLPISLTSPQARNK